jgi:hypothetical protein
MHRYKQPLNVTMHSEEQLYEGGKMKEFPSLYDDIYSAA